jgi:predicted Zn-dependent protease
MLTSGQNERFMRKNNMNYLINQAMSGATTKKLSLILRLSFRSLVIVWLLLGCATVPHTGRRQFNMVSDNRLNGLGARAFNEVVVREPESGDKRLVEIVRKVTDRVAKAAEAIDKPGFKWDVRVVDRDDPNAVCLPGGKIIVHSGIAPYAKNEAGLAAIIGHEVAHSVARHSGERLSQQVALQGVIDIGREMMKQKEGKLDNKARMLLGALGLGATLGIVLPYSRVHELEADRIGQLYMARAGYDPEEAPLLWERMSKIKKPPIPVWLSTHPANEERVRKMRESLPEAQKMYSAARAKYGIGTPL